MTDQSYNILQLLPHRYPFLLLDTVDMIDISLATAQATKVYSEDCFLLQGLSNEESIVPPGLLIESIAQLSAVISMIMSKDNDAEHTPQPGYLAAILDFNYFKPIRLGNKTTIMAKITHSFGSMLRSYGEIRCDNEIVVNAELSFRIDI